MSTSPSDRPLTIEDIRAQQSAASGIPSNTVGENADPEFVGSPSTDIEIRVRSNAAIVLTDKKVRQEFYSYIRQEVESFVPDLTTDKGRKAVASLAFKVSQSKSLIEKAKISLKAEWVEKSRAVDADWRVVERDLDELRDQARKPLTDWEESEATRKAICQATITRLNSAAIVAIDATVESVHATLADLRIIPTDENSMQEYSTMATEAKSLAVKSLSTALTRLEKEEADHAELARLRAANEARIIAEMEAAAHEEEERLKREAAEQQRAAEEKRVADEQARIQQAADTAAREAAAKLQREHDAELKRIQDESDQRERDAQRKMLQDEQAARDAADKLAADYQSELDRARKAQEEAESRERAEAKRIADAEAKRVAEEARLKKIADDKTAEDERLAKNKKNRQERMTAAKLALMQYCGIEEKHAIAVVKMIVDEKIPNISFNFVDGAKR